MDDKNPFLDAYKKKITDEKTSPAEGAPVQEAAAAPLHFEEKSEFVRIEPTRPPTTPARGAGKRAAAIVVVSAVVLCAVILLVWLLGRGFESQDMTGWALSDAQIWASDNNINLQVEEQYSDDVDEDKIISQSPAGGTLIKKGSFVKVVVSLGHDLTVTLPLPDLMSMTKTEIDAWAAENFMTKVRIAAEFSDTVESGKVISYEINDTTVVDEVKRNTPIYIIVSKGKENPVAVPVTVPNFKQMTIQQSNVFANENGIILEIIEAYDDYAERGSIIAQSVKADTKVNKGDTIKLTVSKGKKILLPDFSTYSKERAQAVATELDITASIVEKYSDQVVGGFISQSLEAGSVYAHGDILELFYSLGNKLIISSYVGQTKDAIETWAQALNNQGASITIKTTYTQSEVPKNTIIYQDKTNTSISVKSSIYITVSLGKTVFVPDFIAPEGADYNTAVTREKALAMCQEIGIVPVFVKEDIAGRLPGEIWYQSAAAGTEIYQGKTITLKYKPVVETINIPAFVGMTQADIVAAGYLKKLNITFILADMPVEGYFGKIYGQSVAAGTTVAYGTAITLQVSPASP